MNEEDGKFLELIGKNYRILDRLYPDYELSITDLATVGNMDRANLSRKVTEKGEFRKYSVLNTRKEPRPKHEGGRAYTMCSLTEETRVILTTVHKLKQKEEKPLMEQYAFFAKLITNRDFPEDFRCSCLENLKDEFTRNPQIILKTKLKDYFETIAEKPFSIGEVGKLLRKSLPIEQLLHEKGGKLWLKELYNKWMINVENSEKEEKIRDWSISMATRFLVRFPDMTEKVLTRFLKTYWKDELVADSSLAGNIRIAFTLVYDRVKTSMLKTIAEKIKSEDKGVRDKAIRLLEEFSQYSFKQKTEHRSRYLVVGNDKVS